ncbi:MAG: hypothetical protein JNJ54_00710 [Myxococcaceae bacterium]|nr:hypothetical protein [Myxococcaceae bacterium]
MARFVVAVSLLVVVSGSSCGGMSMRFDAGATGGGLTGGTGGGLSATGGGATGGGSTGGGSAGGSAGGAASSDGGCTAISAIAPPSSVFGSYTIGSGNNAGLEWWTSQIATTNQAGTLVSFFISELYQQPPMLVTFPFTGAMPANTNYQNCQVCLQAALGCDRMGNNCQGEFLATSGNFSFTEGTMSPDAGRFVGAVTNVTYRQWNFMADMPAANGTCFTVPSISFTGVWPFDGGM